MLLKKKKHTYDASAYLRLKTSVLNSYYGKCGTVPTAATLHLSFVRISESQNVAQTY